MGRLGKMVLQLEDGTEINLGNILKEGVGNKIKDSDVMVPVDIQSRYQKTIAVHNAQNIANGVGATSGFIDVSGFEDVAVLILNDASTASSVDIGWSIDGVLVHGIDYNIITGNARYKAGIIPTKAKWVRVTITNTDTIAHTFSSWLYLKA